MNIYLCWESTAFLSVEGIVRVSCMIMVKGISIPSPRARHRTGKVLWGNILYPDSHYYYCDCCHVHPPQRHITLCPTFVCALLLAPIRTGERQRPRKKWKQKLRANTRLERVTELFSLDQEIITYSNLFDNCLLYSKPEVLIQNTSASNNSSRLCDFISKSPTCIRTMHHPRKTIFIPGIIRLVTQELAPVGRKPDNLFPSFCLGWPAPLCFRQRGISLHLDAVFVHQIPASSLSATSAHFRLWCRLLHPPPASASTPSSLPSASSLPSSHVFLCLCTWLLTQIPGDDTASDNLRQTSVSWLFPPVYSSSYYESLESDGGVHAGHQSRCSEFQLPSLPQLEPAFP